MTGVLMLYRDDKCESQGKLRLDKCLRDATRDHLKRQFPTNTAKLASRAYKGLTLSQARHAVEGNPSLATIELIFKRGGFAVALPILEEVIGEQLARHLIELRASHEVNGERLGALLGDLWPSGPDRPPNPDSLDSRDSGRRVFGRRGVGQV